MGARGHAIVQISRGAGHSTVQVSPWCNSFCEVGLAGGVGLRDAAPVHVARDLPEDADRRRAGRVVGQLRERERESRIVAAGVVDEQRLLADVGDVDDPQRSVLPHRHAALAVGDRS